MDPNSAEADEARSLVSAQRKHAEARLHILEQERDEDGAIDSAGGDPGADTTSAATYLGAIEDLQNELEEIDLALRRIDDGTYGIDEVTGEPIDPARLEAEPTARVNVGTRPPLV
jgi:RNA polymerase-binding transcription factor DksA